MLRHSHVSQRLLPVAQVSVGARQQGVSRAVAGGKLLRHLQFIDSFLVAMQTEQAVGQRQVESGLVGRKLQRGPVFVHRVGQQSQVTIGCRPNQVDGQRISHLVLRQLRLPQRHLGMMQIEAGVGQAHVGLAVLRVQPESGLEICRRRRGLVKIFQHISAVYISCNHGGIQVEHAREIFLCLLQFSRMLVHITCQQRNIWLFGKRVAVAGNESPSSS